VGSVQHRVLPFNRLGIGGEGNSSVGARAGAVWAGASGLYALNRDSTDSSRRKGHEE
jgi:hypothetical protein